MEGGYLTQLEWMLELDLRGGNELAAYALVYGFSKDGKSWYQGSASYVARWLKCTVRTARETLHRLAERGLLETRERVENNVRFVDYRVAAWSVGGGREKSSGVGKIFPGGRENFSLGGRENFSPHNTTIDNEPKGSTKDKDNARARGKFDLPYSGKEFLEVWTKLVRQPKWRKKSDDAIEESIAKLAKVDEATAIEMMRNSIERNWQGVFYPDRPKSGGWQRQAQQGESREAKAMREANEALQRVADRRARETGGGSAYDEQQQLIEFNDYDYSGDN